MRWSRKVLVVLAGVAFGLAGAQPTAHGPAQGYWVDLDTKLMWAGQDNGKDVSWKGGKKYCKNLRLAGYSDWRLATLAELQGLYDKKVEVPGLSGTGRDQEEFTWHVKGNLFLTGDEWSSDFRADDRGKNSGYVYYFDFNEGRSNDDPTGFPYPFAGMRALCVRRPGA
jgi:hypothetical protein